MPTDCLNRVLVASTSEIAIELLGVDVEQSEIQCVLPSECQGSGLTLKIDGHSYEIGIVTKRDSSQQISKAMLGLGDDDEPLEDDELLDAIGELVNMIAGRVKGKLSDEGGVVELATPQEIDLETWSPQGLMFKGTDFEFSIFITSHCTVS
jgi:CheY-specific phosphatase CheX